MNKQTLEELLVALEKALEEAKKDATELIGPIYGVPWIDNEEPDGWRLFTSLENCLYTVKGAWERGTYDCERSYYGPERPLYYYKLPVEGLEPEYIEELKCAGIFYTGHLWQPKYLGEKISIK